MDPTEAILVSLEKGYETAQGRGQLRERIVATCGMIEKHADQISPHDARTIDTKLREHCKEAASKDAPGFPRRCEKALDALRDRMSHTQPRRAELSSAHSNGA